MIRKRAPIQVIEGRGKTSLSHQMLAIREMCRLSYMAAAVYENFLAAGYCPKYDSFSRNFLIETNIIRERSI